MYTNYSWVTVIIVDSPYEGNASGSSSQTMVSQFTFSSRNLVLTSSTSSYSAADVPVSNGQDKALMELTQWTVYNTYTSYHESWSPFNDPCTNPYVAKLTATYSQSTATAKLLSSGSTADYNEQTNIHKIYRYNPGTKTRSYWNVVTLRNIDFSTQTGSVNTLSGGDTLKTDQQTMISFGISISFPGDSAVGLRWAKRHLSLHGMEQLTAIKRTSSTSTRAIIGKRTIWQEQVVTRDIRLYGNIEIPNISFVGTILLHKR